MTKVDAQFCEDTYRAKQSKSDVVLSTVTITTWRHIIDRAEANHSRVPISFEHFYSTDMQTNTNATPTHLSCQGQQACSGAQIWT